ncbi:MAG TPA: 1-(5-phosphoribosyl)-5-[(5-phosphoribosylamino)methylideneamino] imidazole-4-carboxamide isomerase [Levilinea sp.]|nr:1-(5-phosphoribosyl)-5-[(5-phosphoribosylamino)methylideneamino] imidazole-4-carboxamide isomerase [Levilinea sp.]
MNPDFTVFPAIDLRHGQVVRLSEGDPLRQTQYASDPSVVARRWLSAGAKWLHVVNLDGAFEQPDAKNRQALAGILAAAQESVAHVQFGGGLRSLAIIAEALSFGITRAVLGTLAIEQPELAFEALHRWGPERIVLGLDARDGFVRVRGWQAGAGRTVVEVAESFLPHGLKWLVYTDIARDGLQTGLNLPATVRLAEATGLQVIASGGVRNLADLSAAHAAGLAGVIAGRALYEGNLPVEGLFEQWTTND